MMRKYRGMLIAAALAAGVLVSGGVPVYAQDEAGLTDSVPEMVRDEVEVKSEDASSDRMTALPDAPKAETLETMPEKRVPVLPELERKPLERAEPMETEEEAAPEPEQQDGWVTADGLRYYYEAGQPVKGWRKIEGKLRYFDMQSGVMAQGWLTLKGHRYFTDGDGGFCFGWQRIEGKLRYFDYGTGAMAIGLTTINGKTYYTDDDGIFRFGWQDFDGEQRYFDYGTGAMVLGWQRIEGKLRYFDPENGFLAIGWTSINGKTYYTHEDGTFHFGWLKLDDRYYHLNKGTGALDRGLIKIAGEMYYLDEDGCMQVGWHRVGGKLRYFDPESGAMAVGWTTIGGRRYYTYSDGTFAFGWSTVEGKLRYFDPSSGIMLTGLQDIGAGRYYILSDGSFYFGWARVGGRMHYFDQSTGRMRFGWVTLGGRWYYFNSDGSSIGSGWKKIGDITYYFDDATPAPHALHDTTKQIGEHLFRFNSEGVGRWADNEFSFRNEFRVTRDRLYLYDSDGDVYASRWVSERHVVVSLAHQYLWAFENGKLAFETPVITGKPSTPTVRGAFEIYSMERDVILRGDDYASPVSYWMPFYLGYGLHDAPWQSSYNFEMDSDANYRVGSHGCINLKPSVAKRVYWFLNTGSSVNIY